MSNKIRPPRLALFLKGKAILTPSRLVILLMTMLVVVLLLRIYAANYETLLNDVKPREFKYEFESSEYSKVYFSKDRYHFLKQCILLMIPLVLSIGFYLGIKSDYLTSKGTSFLKFIRKETTNTLKHFDRIPLNEKRITYTTFCIIFFIRIISLIELKGVHEDEFWSFKYFVSQGPLICITYYPDTNNHILSNLISSFFYKIYPDLIFSMKVPVFLQSIIAEIIIFFSLNRIFNYRIALLALTLTGCAAEITVFSIVGRGHMLCSLLSLFALLSLMGYLKSKDANYLICLVVFVVLGFYTVPTFLYFFAALYSFAVLYLLCKKELTLLNPLSIALIAILAGTFLLYLPIIEVSGLKALTGTKWINPSSKISFQRQFIVYALEYFEAMADLIPFGNKKYIGVLVILGLFTLTFIKSKNKNTQLWMAWMILATLIPLVVCLYMRVLAPYRVFVYLIFFFFICLSILINSVLEKLKVTSIIFYLLLLIIFSYQIYNQIFNRGLLPIKSSVVKSLVTSDRNIDHYI